MLLSRSSWEDNLLWLLASRRSAIDGRGQRPGARLGIRGYQQAAQVI